MSCEVAETREQEKKSLDDWGREMPNIFARDGMS
jgi:hypothetical protein